MMLSAQDIVGTGLIASNFDPKSLRDSGYDLRIATLMKKSSKSGLVEDFDEDVNLPPQGIVAAVSIEELKLPNDVCAYASVKTSLCREGILAINTGVIDPGWEGPLSSLLLNFGNESYALRPGDTFVRLTFHRIANPSNAVSNVQVRAAYEDLIRRKFNRRLAETFMNVDAVAGRAVEQFNKDMRGALLKYLPLAAIILTVLTFLLNFGTLKLANWTTPSEMVLIRAKALTSDVQRQADKEEQENQDLRQQVQELRQQLEQLKKHQ
jgi:deoxycytidine triphosphate deaminase